MDDSIEKYSASPMFQSSSVSPPPSASTTFDNTDYNMTISGDNSPINGTTKTMTIVDGRFFRMIPEKCIMNTTVATCVKCEPRYIEIKGNVNSSSNFLCHLKRKHGIEAVQEYTEYLHSKKRCRRTQPLNAVESARQNKLKAIQLQEQLDRNILKFIVDSMMPMETVTNSSFLEIFKSFNVPEQDLKVFNRDILNAKLVNLFHQTSEQLKLDMREASEVCFMANMWQQQEGTSSSCLVTMAHWIDCEMMRRSAVLRIKKLSSAECRYEYLEHILEEIKEEFNIRTSKLYSSSNLTCNLKRAFNAYGIDKNSIVDPLQDVDEEIILKNDIISALQPRRLVCYAEVLRNLASFDVVKVISNCRMLSNLHGRVVQKCNFLWSHPEANDILEEITGTTLTKPSANSWISLYSALAEILTIKDKSMEIFQAFDIKDHLNAMDFLYIEEHLACTKPLADALSILEDSQHSLFGSLLPTLLALRRHLNKLIKREWTYCGSLITAIGNMVSEEFNSFYKFENYVAVEAAIAAFSHPEFKNRWLSCVDMNLQTNMLQAFKAAVENELPKSQSSDTKEGILHSQSRSDFFDFGSENEIVEPMPSKTVVDMQVLNYFNYTSRSLDSLKHFPEIFRVFMKYNSPLSSFAIVDQMFDRDILKRVLMMPDKTLDQYFEMKIWLKANKNLF